MEDLGQISLPIDLEKEILEEDKIRLKEEENMVEALLFSLGRSVSVEEIAVCLNMGKDGATLAAERLRERYEERQEGLIIKKLEDRYQMMSHPKTSRRESTGGIRSDRRGRETGCARKTDAFCHNGGILKPFRRGFSERPAQTSGRCGKAS